VHGRLDAQVSIGGLKVDLMEVEQVVAELPGVVEAVLVYDRGIEAYAVLDGTLSVAELRRNYTDRLAPDKRAARGHVLEKVARTVTGKLVRELSTLRSVERLGAEAA